MDKEITALWDAIGRIEKKLSDFTDIRHGESTGRLDEHEEALIEVDENYAQRVADVEEALCDLAESMEL